jgi:non-heme chloroperoxidase
MVWLITSAIIYGLICAILVGWPLPKQVAVENYDYASLRHSSQHVALGREQWIGLRDGSKLFARVYDSQSNDTLVLIHGSGSDSRYLSAIASSLAAAGLFTVITPDLRGHGRNPGKRGDVDYIGQLEHDIEDLLIVAQKTAQGGMITLGGHSSGGGLALRYIGTPALKQPGALLLFAPYLGHKSPTTKPNSGDWVTVALKRWIGLTMLNRVGIKIANNLKVLMINRPVHLNDALQVASYAYRMAVNFAPTHYIDDIAKIRVPTLVLVGEDDESFHAEEFEAVFDNAKEYVDVIRVEGAKHLSIVDHASSQNYLVEWYNRIVGASVK